MQGSPRKIRTYIHRYRGPFSLGVVFLVATQAFALSVPPLLKLATDGLNEGRLEDVKTAAWRLFFLAIGGAVVRIASRILIFNGGRRVEYDIRNDLFEHLSRLQPSFYGRMPTGQVMSRAVNDLTQVRLLLGPGLLNLTNTTLVYLVVVPLLLYKDAWLTVASMSILPALLLGGRWIGGRIYRYSREAQQRLADLSTKVQENLGGVMTVRVFGREAAETESFDALSKLYYDSNVALARLRGTLFPLMGLFGAIGPIILLYLGGQRIMADRMTVGDFVEFSGYLAALTWPTIALGWMISLIQRGMAAMDRINDIFRSTPTITDGATAAAPPSGRVEIKSLTFTYPGASEPALRDVNATIQAGEMVVVVGRTGSGKSTLLEALARLIEVPSQTILVDGVDTTSMPLIDLRSRLAYAPQHAFLFSRTIAENITFGRPEATEAQMREAAETAGLISDVEAFPDGFETMVGERGITLSGGQRQRVALARALLVQGPVLLLDDTLSAVDTETETLILAKLLQKKERTLVVVTHRLACAQGADRIIVMDAGQIVEQGSEADLLKLGGIYQQMHARQRRRAQGDTVTEAQT